MSSTKPEATRKAEGPKKNRTYAKALYDFDPETRVEIPLRVNDILEVRTKHKSGWWKGKVIQTTSNIKVGVTGYFPASYCINIAYQPTPVKKEARLAKEVKQMFRMPSRTSPKQPAHRGHNRMGSQTVAVSVRKESGTVKLDTDTKPVEAKGSAHRGKNLPKYNSTTTMMTVDSTISKPDKEATIKGVATMALKLIEKDSKYRSKFDEAPRLGTFRWHKFKLQPERGQPHTVKSLTEFVGAIFKEAQLEVDCIIMSYLYVERIVKCGLHLTRDNVRPVLFMSLLLASKVWDDMSMWNVDFAGIFAALTLKKINAWEGLFLNGIQFNVVVSASEYTAMYFKLREFYSHAKIQLAPLRRDKAEKLEAMTGAALDRIKAKQKKRAENGKQRRAATLNGDICPSPQAVLEFA